MQTTESFLRCMWFKLNSLISIGMVLQKMGTGFSIWVCTLAKNVCILTGARQCYCNYYYISVHEMVKIYILHFAYYWISKTNACVCRFCRRDKGRGGGDCLTVPWNRGESGWWFDFVCTSAHMHDVDSDCIFADFNELTHINMSENCIKVVDGFWPKPNHFAAI